MTHVAAVLGGSDAVLLIRAAGLRLAGLGLSALAEAVMASPTERHFLSRAALGLAACDPRCRDGGLRAPPELVPLAILVAAPLRMPLDFAPPIASTVGLPQEREIGRLLPL